jgi:hypothetical protein
MLRLATRGDLEALIETKRPTVPPTDAFAMLDRLTLRITGKPAGKLERWQKRNAWKVVRPPERA